MKPNVYTPPRYPHLRPNLKTVFLAGSIEMGNCEDWQSRVVENFKIDDIDFFNPRRKEWDSSWEQSLNSPNFYEQVSWELDHLMTATFIYMYIDPTTKSPISLLELGMFANSDKMIVCCPEGFYRRGNIEVVCQKFNVPLFSDFDTSLIALRNKIREHEAW